MSSNNALSQLKAVEGAYIYKTLLKDIDFLDKSIPVKVDLLDSKNRNN